MTAPHAQLEYGSETDGFYFQQLHRKQHYERSKHYHDSFEIYFLISGQRQYFIKDRLYLAQSGDLIFINKYDVHRTTTVEAEHGEHERILIQFSEDYLGTSRLYQTPTLLKIFETGNSLYRLNRSDLTYVRDLFLRMSNEARNKASGFKISLRLLLTELLIFAERLCQRYAEPNERKLDPIHDKITDVVNYIHTHFAEKITLAQVARLVFISPAYLSRHFRGMTGFTFVGYIHHVRIKEAKRLLLESNKKMSEIAEASGFDSFTHFNRTFKKIVCTNPLKYRLNRSLRQDA